MVVVVREGEGRRIQERVGVSREWRVTLAGSGGLVMAGWRRQAGRVRLVEVQVRVTACG